MDTFPFDGFARHFFYFDYCAVQSEIVDSIAKWWTLIGINNKYFFNGFNIFWQASLFF
jgi:hypothetical protein